MKCVDVIVTGSSGFIGSNLVKRLLREGYRVLGVDVVEPTYNCSGHCRFHRVDIRSLKDLLEASKGLERPCIVHLAAIVSVEEAMLKPKETIEVNVVGTINVAELARRLDSPRIVFASSVAVYGEPLKLPISEDHPLNPRNIYGASKVSAEIALKHYNELYGLSYIALRFFNVYGPGMKPGPYAGVVYRFIEALLTNKKPIIYGDGLQTRDFIYVDDVVDAILLALESNYVGAVNIGSGVETKIIDLLKLVEELIGRNIEPIYKPPRPSDVRRSLASIELARRVLGWNPKTQLREGLKKTIEYYNRVFSGKA